MSLCKDNVENNIDKESFDMLVNLMKDIDKKCCSNDRSFKLSIAILKACYARNNWEF